MKKLILLCMMIACTFAQSTFSDPQPSFEHPRKVSFQLNDSNLNKVNQTLNSIYNILKEYPSESLKIVVITYGNGMRALRKDYDSKTLQRIESLMEYEVEFIGCQNTLDSMHWKHDEFLDEITYVQAGLVEVIEKQIDGYVNILAY